MLLLQFKNSLEIHFQYVSVAYSNTLLHGLFFHLHWKQRPQENCFSNLKYLVTFHSFAGNIKVHEVDKLCSYRIKSILGENSISEKSRIYTFQKFVHHST